MIKRLQSTSANSNIRDDDTPQYECYICKDTGFTFTEGIEGSLLAIPCKCREIKKYKKILQQSGISDAFQGKTLSNFMPGNNPLLQKAKKAAIAYVDGYQEKGDEHYSIMFLGQPGAGKTHLAIAIANSLINQVIPVKYVVYYEMVRELKAKQKSPEEFNEAVKPYCRVEVLLIDDLFKNAKRLGRVQETDLNVVFEIINHRYMRQMPTIISSEYKAGDLFEIDEALGSRLIEMAKGNIITFDGVALNHRL